MIAQSTTSGGKSTAEMLTLFVCASCYPAASISQFLAHSGRCFWYGETDLGIYLEIATESLLEPVATTDNDLMNFPGSVSAGDCCVNEEAARKEFEVLGIEVILSHVQCRNSRYCGRRDLLVAFCCVLRQSSGLESGGIGGCLRLLQGCAISNCRKPAGMRAHPGVECGVCRILTYLVSQWLRWNFGSKIRARGVGKGTNWWICPNSALVKIGGIPNGLVHPVSYTITTHFGQYSMVIFSGSLCCRKCLGTLLVFVYSRLFPFCTLCTTWPTCGLLTRRTLGCVTTFQHYLLYLAHIQ